MFSRSLCAITCIADCRVFAAFPNPRLSLPFSGSSSFVAHPQRHHQSSNKVFYPLKEIHYRLTEQNGKKCSPQQPFICFHIRLTISQINSFLMKFGFVFSLCLRIQPGTKVWPQKTTSLFFLVRLTSAVATTQTGWFRLNSHALVRKDVALEIDPIVHEDYNNPLSTSNDIALLKLAEPVDLNIYTPACLADLDADYTGQSGRVYGVFFSSKGPYW